MAAMAPDSADSIASLLMGAEPEESVLLTQGAFEASVIGPKEGLYAAYLTLCCINHDGFPV